MYHQCRQRVCNAEAMGGFLKSEVKEMLKTENKPKHKIISEWIVSRISSGEFSQGDKIPSENELAERFSFSRQTVRQAIANLESGGILVRIKGCGTFVGNAPTRFREKTYTLGVVISCLDDYVFPSILQGIENYLTKNGYLLSFGITYNKLQNEANALSAMIKKGVDGIIVEGTKSALPNPNAAIYKQLKDENTPFIFINGYYENIGDGYVVTDDVAGGSIM
ncbi:MAG: GntR family transcriptional regulator, partial [Oscillospiraceae bacterium]